MKRRAESRNSGPKPARSYQDPMLARRGPRNISVSNSKWSDDTGEIPRYDSVGEREIEQRPDTRKRRRATAR